MVSVVKWIPFLFFDVYGCFAPIITNVDKIWLNVEFFSVCVDFFVPLLKKSRDSPKIKLKL